MNTLYIVTNGIYSCIEYSVILVMSVLYIVLMFSTVQINTSETAKKVFLNFHILIVNTLERPLLSL